MTAEQRLSANELDARRVQLGVHRVSAAELAAADGVLSLKPGDGTIVEIGVGATLRGIVLRDYDDGGAPVDVTTAAPNDSALIFLVCDGEAGSPWTFAIKHEDTDAPTVADVHRLRVITGTAGVYADGVVGESVAAVTYDHDRQRWRVTSAP